jgi:hypothetical protein
MDPSSEAEISQTPRVKRPALGPSRSASLQASREKPRGVVAIAALFFAIAAYLLALGALRLAFPENIRLSLAAPLLHGLELWGPYMFLLCGAASSLIGFGLLCLNNLARRVAAMIAVAGMVMLVPKVSADTADFSPAFFVSGSMIVIRMMVAWYLWQGWTAERFH